MNSYHFLKTISSNTQHSTLAIIVLLSTIGIGVIDYITGSEITFALFYLVPVAFIAWFSNISISIAISLFSAFTWLTVDYCSERINLSIFAYGWNYFSRLAFMVIIIFLLIKIKKLLLDIDKLSREDPVTKSPNLRAFREIAKVEISRATRHGHALSLAYIDIDNFKTINDTLGHEIGNKLLCAVTDTIRDNLRGSDTIARIGGDEFALLLSIPHQAAAHIAITKIRNHLTSVMHKNNWPVTFSMGVLVCIQNIPDIDRMLKMADDLMYSVKKNSKDGVNFRTFASDLKTVRDEPEPAEPRF